jgi:hypothetical protein
MLAIILIIEIEILCYFFKFSNISWSIIKCVIVDTSCHLLSIGLLHISRLLLNHLFLFWRWLWLFLDIVINFFGRDWWLRLFYWLYFFWLRSFGLLYRFLKLEKYLQVAMGLAASFVRQVQQELVFWWVKLAFIHLIFFYGVEASRRQKVNYQRLSQN